MLMSKWIAPPPWIDPTRLAIWGSGTTGALARAERGA